MAEKLAAGASKIIKGVQAVLTPDLVEIKGSLRVVETKVTELEKRMDSFRAEFKSDIARVEQKVDQLNEKLDIDRRMTI